MLSSASVKLYYIYYGAFTPATVNILNYFASKIGGSPWYNIQATYKPSSMYVNTGVNFGGSYTDASYSQGKSLTVANIFTIVTNAINAGKLPKDGNGVYFVLTASDVSEVNGYCTSYCAWHAHGMVAGVDIKYAFVGDPSKLCPSQCSMIGSTAPNGDFAADTMVSLIAHEFAEAVTDPYFTAWYSSQTGLENADMCAWKVGTTYSTANGATANVKLGTRDFLIQQNWLNVVGAQQGCQSHYP